MKRNWNNIPFFNKYPPIGLILFRIAVLILQLRYIDYVAFGNLISIFSFSFSVHYTIQYLQDLYLILI